MKFSMSLKKISKVWFKSEKTGCRVNKEYNEEHTKE
jgi:hypothetical protein